MKKIVLSLLGAVGLLIIVLVGKEMYSDMQRENEILRLENSIYETEKKIDTLDRYLELCDKNPDCE